LAELMKSGDDWHKVRGICYIASEAPEGYLALPDFDAVSNDKNKFLDMFSSFYKYSEPFYNQGLTQKIDNRLLVHNAPQYAPTTEELDSWYDLEFERAPHPYYAEMGKINACETIRHSITSHRGCYGECSFCSITVHQGRRITSRSEESILKEARTIANMPDFKGYISDVGGATANMYCSKCKANDSKALCPNKRCTFPEVCPALELGHQRQVELLRKIRAISGVKKVFIGSGIRFDLIVADRKYGRQYLREIVEHHVSGQMKIAPEHTAEGVLRAMRKNSRYLSEFVKQFNELNRESGKRQFLTYYLMAAHPACGMREMEDLSDFLRYELRANPEQVQIFTPTPSTYSTAMYFTGLDFETRKPIYVEKDFHRKELQKKIICGKSTRK
jgi:uncharacterized radical SAM protein YgiQ